MKNFQLLIVLIVFTGCFNSKSTFDKTGNLDKLGLPSKIEYYKHIPGRSFQYSDTAFFTITKPVDLEKAMMDIKKATDPEPWKGAGWNRIQLHYADTIVNILTNNKRIGTTVTGSFYA